VSIISYPGLTRDYIEKYKWGPSETWMIFVEDLPIATLQPAAGMNMDWRWCWQRFPYLHDTEKPR